MRVREGRNNAIQSAIKKYGADNFSVRTLVVADDWQYLCDLERRAIVAFRTKTPNGYNLTDGGEGAVGVPLSDATRRKMSASQKTRFTNPSELEKLSARSRAAAEKRRKPRPPKRAPGAATKELWKDPCYRERLTRAIRAAANQPETKLRQIAAAKSRAETPGWREKVSASRTGQKLRPMSDEHKAKIAAARRQEWQDPVIRQRRLAALCLARSGKTAKEPAKAAAETT